MDDGGFFVVVGVLIWTIPAILLWRAPPHWWGCLWQKIAYDFVCFWLRFFLSSDDKKNVLFAVLACGGMSLAAPI